MINISLNSDWKKDENNNETYIKKKLQLKNFTIEINIENYFVDIIK